MNNFLKIKIQLIGSFIYYKNIDLDNLEYTYFESIANRLQIPLKEALLDPYFYHLLRLEKYQSYQDLKGISYSGLDVKSFHQIELFVDGHKKQKFNYWEINPETILFPLYNSERKKVNLTENGLLIKWKEKGVISFKSEITDIPLDRIFSFKIIDCMEHTLISKISCNNEYLSVSKRDTVITL